MLQSIGHGNKLNWIRRNNAQKRVQDDIAQYIKAMLTFLDNLTNLNKYIYSVDVHNMVGIDGW